MLTGAINRISSGLSPDELMRRARRRLHRANQIDRAQLLDAAVRNEARQSCLPYLRSLHAMLGLLNEPETVTVRLIREEYRRLLSLRSRLLRPADPNAIEPAT